MYTTNAVNRNSSYSVAVNVPYTHIPHRRRATRSAIYSWNPRKNEAHKEYAYTSGKYKDSTTDIYSRVDLALIGQYSMDRSRDWKKPVHAHVEVPNGPSSNINGNHSMDESPFLLSRAQMLEGFIKGRLCLSCEKVTHPMPKCPSRVFVCPNCHKQGHRGESCTERCRFCQRLHKGKCIMDCIQEAAQIERLKNDKIKAQQHPSKFASKDYEFSKEDRLSHPLVHSHSSSHSKLVSLDMDDDFDMYSSSATTQVGAYSSEEQNVSTELDLSSRPDNAWGRSIYMKGIPQEVSEDQVCSEINSYLTRGFVTKVQLFPHKEHAFVTVSSMLAAAELISKRVIFRGKLLNLQWRKSGGFIENTSDIAAAGQHCGVSKQGRNNPVYFNSESPEHTIHLNSLDGSNAKANCCTDTSSQRDTLVKDDSSIKSENASVFIHRLSSVLYNSITVKLLPFDKALEALREAIPDEVDNTTVKVPYSSKHSSISNLKDRERTSEDSDIWQNETQ